MDSRTYVVVSIIIIGLWFIIGLIIIAKKIYKMLCNLNFQFRCVCDECKETFIFPYKFIQKNYFINSIKNVKMFEINSSGRKYIGFYPKYKKYAKKIVCPKCNKKGMVRVENFDEWLKFSAPYSQKYSCIYMTILAISTYIICGLLIFLEQYIV